MKKDVFYRLSVRAGRVSCDISPDIRTLTVEEGGAGADRLTVELADPCKVLSHALQEGMQVETDLGTVSDHSIIFRGRIYKVEGRFTRDVTTLKVVAFDKSMDMGLRKRSRQWTDRSLEDIVRAVAGSYFSSPDIRISLKGNPRFTGNGMRQHDETDLAFLLRLASQYGCEMFVICGDKSDQMHFKAQYAIMKEEPLVTLYHGRSVADSGLARFEASADAGKVKLPRLLAGIDFDSGQTIEQVTSPVEEAGSAEDRFSDEHLARFASRYPQRVTSVMALMAAADIVRKELHTELGPAEREVTPGFTTPDDLRKRAENQFSTSINGMAGSGLTLGNHRIHARATIGIADAGRFSGTWYLAKVRHLLDREGYRTEFECRR